MIAPSRSGGATGGVSLRRGRDEAMDRLGFAFSLFPFSFCGCSGPLRYSEKIEHHARHTCSSLLA